jgi:hypothetical protein
MNTKESSRHSNSATGFLSGPDESSEHILAVFILSILIVPSDLCLYLPSVPSAYVLPT